MTTRSTCSGSTPSSQWTATRPSPVSCVARVQRRLARRLKLRCPLPMPLLPTVGSTLLILILSLLSLSGNIRFGEIGSTYSGSTTTTTSGSSSGTSTSTTSTTSTSTSTSSGGCTVPKWGQYVYIHLSLSSIYAELVTIGAAVRTTVDARPAQQAPHALLAILVRASLSHFIAVQESKLTSPSAPVYSQCL